MKHPSTQHSPTPGSGSVLILAFKAAMLLNAFGVSLIMMVALDLVPLTLPSYWLRLPLAMFLAGMMLCLLGLFWTGILRTVLWRQQLSGTARYSHWLPALFAMISHFLALAMFAAACWALLGVTSLAGYHDDVRGTRQGSVPYFQHP